MIGSGRASNAYQRKSVVHFGYRFQPATNGLPTAYRPNVCRLPTAFQREMALPVPTDCPNRLPTAFQRLPTQRLQATNGLAPNALLLRKRRGAPLGWPPLLRLATELRQRSSEPGLAEICAECAPRPPRGGGRSKVAGWGRSTVTGVPTERLNSPGASFQGPLRHAFRANPCVIGVSAVDSPETLAIRRLLFARA